LPRHLTGPTMSESPRSAATTLCQPGLLSCPLTRGIIGLYLSNMKLKRWSIVLIVAVFVAAMGGSVFGCGDSWTALFKPHLDEYLEMALLDWGQPGQPSSLYEALEAGGYLRGKLVVVNKNPDKLSPLNKQLVDLRAASPEEVGTVVLLSYFEMRVGTFEDRTEGLQQKCELTVYDLVEKKIVCMRQLEGSMPWVKEGAGDKTGGEVSDDAILAILRALPKQ
jgi:hypothetical protein